MASPRSVASEAVPSEEESKEGIGVPLISVNGVEQKDRVTESICLFENMPTPEEVWLQ